MTTEFAEPLPKMLTGAILPQWVRCGKPRCRCARGQLHGPYFFRFWREGGWLRKEYVRPRDLERVRAQCQARRGFQRQLRDGWAQWRRLRDTLRGAEQT